MVAHTHTHTHRPSVAASLSQVGKRFVQKILGSHGEMVGDGWPMLAMFFLSKLNRSQEEWSSGMS